MDIREKSVRTLVVDDSPIALRSICSVLQELPLIKVVGTAGDGRQAVALASALRPDLVLLDVQMPVMTGVEAVPRLLHELPGTRVVMVTVHDTPEIRQACIECGAHGFIAKEHVDRELPSLLMQMFNQLSPV